MNPTAIGVLVWMVAAPVFLVLWLLCRRKFNKLSATSLQAADQHQAALARGGAPQFPSTSTAGLSRLSIAAPSDRPPIGTTSSALWKYRYWSVHNAETLLSAKKSMARSLKFCHFRHHGRCKITESEETARCSARRVPGRCRVARLARHRL